MYRAFLIPIFVALIPLLLPLLVMAKLLFPHAVTIKWVNILGMLAIDVLVILLITLN